MDTVEQFETAFEQLLHELLHEQTTTAIGIQLVGTKLVFDLEQDFPMKGITFAFFDPIANEIHISINDKFFNEEDSELQESKLLFILIHECMHSLLDHRTRQGTRDQTSWNLAADFEIHNLIYTYCTLFKDRTGFYSMFRRIMQILDNCDLAKPKSIDWKLDEQFCFNSEYIEMTAEEIYETLDSGKMSSDSIFLDDKTCTRSTCSFDDGRAVSTIDVQGKSSRSSTDQEMTRQMMRYNFLDIEDRMKGEGHSCFRELLKKLTDVKLDWENLLKLSLHNILEKSTEMSWSRPRASMLPLDLYLPSNEEDYSAYGTLMLVRDESGSMDKSDLAKAAAVIVSAEDKYSRLLVLKHAVTIDSIKEYEHLDKNAIDEIYTTETIGGTSHKAVFEFIGKYYIEHRFVDDKNSLSCVVLFTDCESDIERYQNTIPAEIPLVYIVPKKTASKYKDRIRGTFIEI